MHDITVKSPRVDAREGRESRPYSHGNVVLLSGGERKLNRRRVRIAGVGLLAAAVVLAASPAGAWAADAAQHVAAHALSAFDAVILGLVEGVTEYLPISSTGHLLITARILDLPTHGKAGDAIKSYEIAIQFGAILAVLVLYWGRVREMFNG